MSWFIRSFLVFTFLLLGTYEACGMEDPYEGEKKQDRVRLAKNKTTYLSNDFISYQKGQLKVPSKGKEHFTALKIQRPIKTPIPGIACGYEAIYERFLQGTLIYKPNKKNDKGKVELRIASLLNSLEGEFDLSQCGEAKEYLRIYTGYRKAKNPENDNKIEIWLAPHFLIERNLAGSASHFKDIMGSWDSIAAPVGMFFIWGGWNNLGWYDYATKLNWDDYNHVENSLIAINRDACTRGPDSVRRPHTQALYHHSSRAWNFFYFVFDELKLAPRQ